ncbi:hypothetical protein RFM98_30515 [Mesorhizobium sp. VK9D]|nr:hypothetical protein [Mesorhizobium sp. VK9D]MDX8457071.1 hypothetical protein [Mesorhizobium sp. VK9D]
MRKAWDTSRLLRQAGDPARLMPGGRPPAAVFGERDAAEHQRERERLIGLKLLAEISTDSSVPKIGHQVDKQAGSKIRRGAMRSRLEAGMVRRRRQVNDAKAGFCCAWIRMTFIEVHHPGRTLRVSSEKPAKRVLTFRGCAPGFQQQRKGRARRRLTL